MKFLLTIALLSLPLFAQQDRPTRLFPNDPVNPCSVITPNVNNWVQGRIWQCVGAAGVNNGTWRLVSMAVLPQQTFADIRLFGAVCKFDGADQNAAVQAALAAGQQALFIPAGCTWIAPSGQIPDHLQIRGENSATSFIKSAATPSTTPLTYGVATTLENLNLLGNGPNGSATDCPVRYAINASAITQTWLSTCNSSFDSFGGMDNTDRTAAFFKVGAFPTGITGDAANFSNCVGNPGCRFTGNSLRTDTYASVAGLAALLATAMPGSTSATQIIQTTNNAPGTSPTHWILYDPYRTSGNMIELHTRGAANNGNGIAMEMADLSGSFGGSFEVDTVAGALVQQRWYNGAITQAGVPFAAMILFSPPDGTWIYCTNCNSTCTAGGGTGRSCFKENGAWTH
jgi:hypothetical protein